MSRSGTSVSYTYNEDGLRVQKNVSGTVTSYILHGKNVVELNQGGNVLHFFYGADGSPAVVVYNGAGYGYVKNLQGDIVSIVNSSGAEVVHYSYDAWGRLLGKTGTLATSLGTLNPFRYRGYVYDEETGLYYLRSRYYNPTWGRFVNADVQLSYLQLLKCNLFSYCQSNPVVQHDPDGAEAISTLGKAGVLWATFSVADGPFPIGEFVGLVAAFALIIGTKSVSQQSTRSQATPIAKPASMTYTGVRQLEDVQVSDDYRYGGTYYFAYLGSDGYLYKVGPAMGYREAAVTLGALEVRRNYASKYGKKKWGVYTEQQVDAKALAIVFGCEMAPEVHGVNYFGHYHDKDHDFHIWFGFPIP